MALDSTAPQYTRPARGWSVMELLVTVVMVTALFLMTAAVFGVLRKHHATARCTQNLRQIGVGLHVYAHERGVFPYYISGSIRWFDGSGTPRSFFAGPYLGSVPWSRRYAGPNAASAKNGLFDCPAITTADKAGLGSDDFIEDYFDYGLNLSLCGRTPASIANPGRTVAVVEGGHFARVKAQHTKGITYTPDDTSNPGGTAWNWSATHGGTTPIIYPKNGQACFLFLDGHVALHSHSELAENWFNGK